MDLRPDKPIFKNRITEILGTTYPMLQGPMRFVTMGEVAATVSRSGGYGQIAASGISAIRLREEINKARDLTSLPFGVNIALHRSNAFEALEIAIEMGIQTITTSGGSPLKVMDRIKKAGIKVLHKVSTLEMALKAEAAGVDGVIATGYEAGGHLGRTDATTFCLVPQLVDYLKIPVVAAGGVADYRGFLAALVLGAEGVEVGTRFLATRECPVPVSVKQLVINARSESTVVINKDKTMPMRVLMAAGGEDREKEQAVYSCGQSAGLCMEIEGSGEIFPSMMEEAGLLSMKINKYFSREEER